MILAFFLNVKHRLAVRTVRSVPAGGGLREPVPSNSNTDLKQHKNITTYVTVRHSHFIYTFMQLLNNLYLWVMSGASHDFDSMFVFEAITWHPGGEYPPITLLLLDVFKSLSHKAPFGIPL